MLNIHTMILDQADSQAEDRAFAEWRAHQGSILRISYTALSSFEGHLVGLWMENDGHLTSLDDRLRSGCVTLTFPLV